MGDVLRGPVGFPAIAAVVLAVLLPAFRLSAQEPGSLPAYYPLDPLATSRSGLYEQPYLEPRRGWAFDASFDYGNISDYKILSNGAEALTDLEAYRLRFVARHDLGRMAFVQMELAAGGSWDGMFDGFFNWYHGIIGYRKEDRTLRPQNQFAYHLVAPDSAAAQTYDAYGIYLADPRLSVGIRWTSFLQSMASATFPTAPDGYGMQAVSLNLINTARVGFGSRIGLESSASVGYTPKEGTLSPWQEDWFYAFSLGLRGRVSRVTSFYGDLYYHSPYYSGTGMTIVDRQEFTGSLGAIFRNRSGREWWVGITENLAAEDPAMDLILRVGTRW